VNPLLRCLLLASVLLLGCSSKSRPRVYLSMATQPAPKGALVIPGWINGHGPHTFGIDTGASGQVYIDADFAKTLDLPVIDQIQASDGNQDRSQSLDLVRIERFKAAGRETEGIPAVIINSATPENIGFLGFEFFRGRLLIIDFDRNEVRTAKGKLGTPDGRRILRFTVERGTPHIPVSLAGTEIQVHLDTGAEGPLLLPRTWIGKLPLKAPPVLIGRMATLFGEEDLYEATLNGDMTIGMLLWRDPVIRFSDLLDFPNLGRDTLAGCRLTFDQSRDRVRLEPPPPR
jgi:predicted aspartyl protease